MLGGRYEPVNQVASYYAFVNRLADGLGVALGGIGKAKTTETRDEFVRLTRLRVVTRMQPVRWLRTSKRLLIKTEKI